MRRAYHTALIRFYQDDPAQMRAWDYMTSQKNKTYSAVATRALLLLQEAELKELEEADSSPAPAAGAVLTKRLDRSEELLQEILSKMDNLSISAPAANDEAPEEALSDAPSALVSFALGMDDDED